jgi:hypothetical protein
VQIRADADADADDVEGMGRRLFMLGARCPGMGKTRVVTVALRRGRQLRRERGDKKLAQRFNGRHSRSK